VTVIVAIESNLGLVRIYIYKCIVNSRYAGLQEAAHISHMLSEMKNVICLRETGKAGRAGVVTTQERKMQFVAVLERLLAEVHTLHHRSSCFSKLISADFYDPLCAGWTQC
jgi:hypothetical protein